MPRRKTEMPRAKPLTIEEAPTKYKTAKSKKCRYCTNERSITRFLTSQDFLDTDGLMSVCKDCVKYLFNYYYSIHSRIDIAIYECCRCLNVRYDSKCYSRLKVSLEKNSMENVANSIAKGFEDGEQQDEFDEIAVDTQSSTFAKYYAILLATYRDKDMDLTFDVYKNDRPEGYEDKTTDKAVVEAIDDAYAKKLTQLERKWGRGLEEDDYAYLESEYQDWAKSKDVDNKSVDTLIREVCIKQMDIRKLREGGAEVPKKDIDTLMALMDKCAITPDKEKETSSSKSQAAFGVWVKDVETLSPAEWVENQKLFKDVEGIDDYVKRTYDRAVRNYIGMQRDFRVVADKMEQEAESFDSSEIAGFEEIKEDIEEEPTDEQS